MSENITNGVIEKIRKDRKGVCCGGEWYSVRNASIFSDAQRGDLLTADFTRNGQWINCTEDTVKVTKSATAGKSGGSSGNGGSKNDQFRTRSEIIRTTALDASIAFLGTQDGTYADNVEQTLKTAQLFVAYVEGKIAVDMGKAAATPANDEQAQAEAEAAAAAAAEAAVAAAAAAEAAKAAEEAPSALSSFLGTE